jgi:hypothetical protein
LKTIKTYLIFFLLLLFVNNLFSQEFITEDEALGKTKKENKFLDRVYFGGDLGIAFGTVTAINIAPEAGYIFSDRFSAGAGIIYQYFNVNSAFNPYSSTVYGGKIFARFFVWENLFLYNVNEIVNLETIYYDRAELHLGSDRFWYVSPLVGIGYMQKFSNKGGIGLMLLFDLNNSINSPYYGYPMPIIRVGIGF